MIILFAIHGGTLSGDEYRLGLSLDVQAKYAALQSANYTTLEKAKIGADEGLLKIIDAVEAKLFPHKFTNQGMSRNAERSMFL